MAYKQYQDMGRNELLTPLRPMHERMHSHASKRSLRFVVGVLFLLGVTGTCAMLLVQTFTIKQVLVDAPGMTVEIDPARFGTNLLTIPTEKLRQELLSAYPLLNDVIFEKKLPSTIIVHVKRRDPFALIQSKGSTYAIDTRGLVLGSIDINDQYPILIVDVGILPTGTLIQDVRVQGVLSFLKTFQNSKEIRGFYDRDSASILAKMGNTNIILPQKKDLSDKAATLQLLIEGFRIKGILPTVIDLRFTKPIITN